MIVWDDRAARFVEGVIGQKVVPPFVSVGIEKEGAVIAGVVFNHFEGHDIHATIAGHGWDRQILREIGDYVFRQLGCERITAVTEQAKVVGFGERLGGQVEGCLRNHFGPGRDGYVIGILKDEYRW